jgi:hypothetical protein
MSVRAVSTAAREEDSRTITMIRSSSKARRVVPVPMCPSPAHPLTDLLHLSYGVSRDSTTFHEVKHSVARLSRCGSREHDGSRS